MGGNSHRTPSELDATVPVTDQNGQVVLVDWEPVHQLRGRPGVISLKSALADAEDEATTIWPTREDIPYRTIAWF